MVIHVRKSDDWIGDTLGALRPPLVVIDPWGSK